MKLALLVAALALSSSLERYEDSLVRFDRPSGWTVSEVPDVAADHALKLDPPANTHAQPALVLIGTKKLTDGDLESASAAWHSAHVKNRAAWGMKLSGGLPRDPLSIGPHRALRYRDRVASALGPADQFFTCTLVSARLCCVLVTSTTDAPDTLTNVVLSSLSLRSKK